MHRSFPQRLADTPQAATANPATAAFSGVSPRAALNVANRQGHRAPATCNDHAEALRIPLFVG